MEGGNGEWKEGGESVPEGGTGRGTGRRRLRWGWEGQGTPRLGDGRARSPSTGGARWPVKPGVLRARVWDAVPGTRAEAGGKGLPHAAPRPARCRAPRARLGLEGSGVPRQLPLRCQTGEEGRQWGRPAPRPSFLLSSALSGD